MGLIVNKPLSEPGFATLLEQLEIVPGPGVAAVPVHFGGPVETARGFVLHSADYSAGGTTMQVDDHFAMTATVEILQDLAEGTAPRLAGAWLCRLGAGAAGE